MQPQRGYKIFEEWGNWLFAAGGSIYDAKGKITLNTPQAKHALNAYIDTYRSAAPPNSLMPFPFKFLARCGEVEVAE